MNEITDKRIVELDEMISNYLRSITALKEAFQINYSILKENKNNYENELVAFVQSHGGNSIVPIDISEIRKVKKVIKGKENATETLKLVPESLFVSMVSQYDYLVGNIVRFIYNVNPNYICESSGSITYSELFNSSDLNSVMLNMLNKRVESLLRESHEDQLKTLASLIKTETLSKFNDYPSFVELTQRRNLFVHSKGIVSNQYVTNCKKAGCRNIAKTGTALSVPQDYFNMSYVLLGTLGVMLSQTIARIILKDNNVLDQIDTSLNRVIYNAIYDEEYEIAIKLSEFATKKELKHSSQLDTVYFVLNKAQAYKWNGDCNTSKKVLSEYDFSAMTDEILVAKYALEDNVDAVVNSMKHIGNSGSIMTELSYADWSIFKEMRKKKKFRDAFKKIFGKDLLEESLSEKEKEELQAMQD